MKYCFDFDSRIYVDADNFEDAESLAASIIDSIFDDHAGDWEFVDSKEVTS